eukprot:41033-Amphidinium_carterae.1
MTVSSRDTASTSCACDRDSSMHDNNKGQGTWHNASHEQQDPAPVGTHLWQDMQGNTANSSTSIAEVPQQPCRGTAMIDMHHEVVQHHDYQKSEPPRKLQALSSKKARSDTCNTQAHKDKKASKAQQATVTKTPTQAVPTWDCNTRHLEQ